MKAGNGHVGRRALMVERVGGPLSTLTPAIQALGCEVARAAEARAAVTLAGTMRRLSLVLINGDTVANDAASLIGSIKGQHPDLPILWFSSDAKAAPPNKVDLATNDPKKLEARISCLLREAFYSAEFVPQVVTAIRNVLDEFGIAAEPSEPNVTSSLTALREINTFLSFTGPRLAGHIVLSTSAGDLTLAYRTRFRKVKFPDLDDIEDLLGEIANQIVGQIKRSIQSEGNECRMGLAHFIRGEGGSIRHKGGAPTLAVDFTNDKQKIHVELCIHRFDGGPVNASGVGEHVRPGTINFL